MKKPNLFIIGAPKCGTTSLAEWLRQHPQVFLPKSRIEPNFFNTDHVEKFRLTLAEYERLFDSVGDQHKHVCEKSVWYLSSTEAVPSILEYSPDAKFVVCVRNPIEMAYALHHHQVFDGIERLSSFRDAWEAQGERATKQDRSARSSTYLLYGWTCQLGAQLERLLARARAERVHVLFMDDIKKAPEAAYAGLLDFLTLSPFTPKFPVVNQAKANRFPLIRQIAIKAGGAKRALGIRRPFGILDRIGRWNRTTQKWQPDEEMTGVLSSYFEEDVALLARLTGRDLSHWLDWPRDVPRPYADKAAAGDVARASPAD
jgi:sulfotransferase family protein